jgi:hypothetical protein
LRDKQKEISVLGVFPERAWRRNRLTVDIIGAAGVLLQHRETNDSDRFLPTTTISTIEDRRSPAFAVGVDPPLLLARHVALAPQDSFAVTLVLGPNPSSADLRTRSVQ